jgi:HEAT repeat protein
MVAAGEPPAADFASFTPQRIPAARPHRVRGKSAAASPSALKYWLGGAAAVLVGGGLILLFFLLNPPGDNDDSPDPSVASNDQKKSGSDDKPKPKKTGKDKREKKSKPGKKGKVDPGPDQPDKTPKKDPDGDTPPKKNPDDPKPPKKDPEDNKPPKKNSEPDPGPRKLPRVDQAGADVRDAVVQGLRVKGSITFGLRTENNFNRQTTYHQWTANLRLENSTRVPLALGTDLFLIEANAAGTTHEGVAVLYHSGPKAVTTNSSYGLRRTYEMRNANGNLMSYFVGGGFFNIRYGGTAPAHFGSLAADGKWPLKRTFEQMTWLRDDLRATLLLVFPEVAVRTQDGVERFRVTAYFKKPVGGEKVWELQNQRVLPLQVAPLKQILEAPENNALTKVLAANWLAEAHPREGVAPLVALGKTVNDGQLCGTCLELLAAVKGAGLGDHALELLKNKQRANGIRRLAAVYLGAVKHEAGLDALAAAAEDVDNVVAEGAITGLGQFGGPRAVKALLGLLQNSKTTRNRLHIAQSLAATKSPDAIKALQELAAKGNDSALEALAQAGLPETYPFFVELAGKAKNQRQRDLVVRGLRSAGGEKALPELLKMLKKEAPPPAFSPQQTTELVRQLSLLNTPKATPELVTLAKGGNLRALQVLAGSKNASVKAALIDLAKEAKEAALRIALQGLQTNWAKDAFEVFVKYLGHSDTRVVQKAVYGLQNGKDPRAAGLLVALLKHKDQGIRSSVSWVLNTLPLGKAASQVAQALADATDDSLTSGLVSALIKAGWKDTKLAGKLGLKLKAAKGYTQYDLIRLLRHLSGNAMGPKDYSEYSKDQAGWVRKWVDWAAKQ